LFTNILQSTKDFNEVTVLFYGTWCPHSKAFAPKWNEHVQYGEGKANITVNENLDSIMDLFNIEGFPTVVRVQPAADWK